MEFFDEQFLPIAPSIGEITNISIVSKIRWLRPRQFLKKQTKVCETISPNDVEEGELANYSFVASLIALAETPERIKGMIRHVEKGKYEVTTYYQGRYANIIIDDLFPCINERPIFTHNKSDDLWVLLIEKAYAKAAGCYAALEGGMPVRTLNNLTGMPVRIFESSDYTQMALYKKLTSYKKKGYYITTSINNYDGDDLESEFGLIDRHTYILSDIFQIDQYKFIRLRDPWNETHWQGKWCDEDGNWTKKMLKKVGTLKPTDGSFLMEFCDFEHFFTTFNVCYCNQEWKHYVGYQMNIEDKQVSFPIECDGHCVISIIQPIDKMRGGLSFWCVDSNDQPIGGQTSRSFVTKYILRGKKLNLHGIKKCRLIVEVCQYDLKKLPLTVNISVRSTAPLRMGLPTIIDEDHYIGYGTKEHAATASDCVACKLPLTIGRVKRVQEIGSFHEKCLKCKKCKKVIHGKWIVKKKKIICEKCAK